MSAAVQMIERVLIQAPATGQDAYGEPLQGWTDVVTDAPDHKVWAAVADLSGREFLAAAATQNAVQTKITIYARAGITAAMRVVHGADTYNILSPLRQLDGTMLLMCERGATA
jgi:SPP1 family predicted phage head-tail adaptor